LDGRTATIYFAFAFREIFSQFLCYLLPPNVRIINKYFTHFICISLLLMNELESLCVIEEYKKIAKSLVLADAITVYLHVCDPKAYKQSYLLTPRF
jgi:hypothetical protein